MKTITAQQMRDLERAAIGSGAVTGLELMERAGKGVVEAVMEEWPTLATGAHRAVVLCGPGNNGGDGFVVARLLRERGWDVDVRLLGDAAKLPPDARRNLDRLDTEVGPMFGADAFLSPLPDLLVDALFGIGLSRPVVGEVAEFFQDQNQLASHMCGVAIDIASGLDADTGDVLGKAFKADLTVTFHLPKPGHFLNDGPENCGKVVVKDIGL